MKAKIALGGDHAGYELKKKVVSILQARGYEVIDHGPFHSDSVDYPDFVHPVCQDLLSGVAELGILICGSGNGVAMTANKYAGIRCGLCWTKELAALARQHNNANALALPARFIDEKVAVECLDAFLQSEFEGGRHARRVNKITPITEHIC